jgi:menaquinone-specific isochorismate synthase
MAHGPATRVKALPPTTVSPTRTGRVAPAGRTNPSTCRDLVCMAPASSSILDLVVSTVMGVGALPGLDADFLACGALLGRAPDRAVLALGPLMPASAPPPGSFSLYAPDFHLRDPRPWRVPGGVVEDHPAALARALAASAPAATGPDAGPLPWREPPREAFARSFAAVKRRLAGGRLDKAVLVAMERAAAGMDPFRLGACLGRVLAAPAPLHAYGLWDATGGIVGATPEVLFRGSPARVETMALAGTRPRPEAERPDEDPPWHDPKEEREHQLTADAIARALAPLGRVQVAPRRVLTLRTLQHFLTEMTLEPSAPVGFETLVRALHPTPALGVAPRDYGTDWLARVDLGRRGRFGAPFGAVWPDGSFLALVAIRNVQWTDAEVRLGSGAGLVAESVAEREWDELARKRRSVKELLGL